MAHPARPLSDPAQGDPGAAGSSSRALAVHAISHPVIVNANDLAKSDLKYVDAAPAQNPGKQSGGAVLRGIRELQKLQKQTIAVLEAVKTSLDDIQQVLRSPEATRGMEKLQNAATLLAKGFAREAVEQATGAVGLLPANPDAHLLLALSLAADQQFEPALAASRKGLALFDRRTHPLAIEAGLLHALASLGCEGEAIDRWTLIIDSLPLPVLCENLRRIAACFPAATPGTGNAGESLLDDLVSHRLLSEEQSVRRAGRQPRVGKIETRPDEIPPAALFAGLDAAHDFRLALTHRALLGQIARRCQLIREAGDTLKFLTECVVPLGNRELIRSANALGRSAIKRLHVQHADAMTLHRALGKLEMAGATRAQQELSATLNRWRVQGNRMARARRGLKFSLVMMTLGLGLAAYLVFAAPKDLLPELPPPVRLWAGPALSLLGVLVGLITLATGTWEFKLPANRPALTPAELGYLNSTDVKRAIAAGLAAR